MSTEGFNWKKLEISDNDVKRNKGEIFLGSLLMLIKDNTPEVVASYFIDNKGQNINQ